MTPLDGEGMYYADLPDGPSGSGTGTLRTIGGGEGAPSGSTPVTTIYVDTSTGFIYSYVNGSWVLVGGGAASSPVYTGGDGDPNGVLTPSDPDNAAWYYQNTGDGSPVSVWQWAPADAVWRPVIT